MPRYTLSLRTPAVLFALLFAAAPRYGAAQNDDALNDDALIGTALDDDLQEQLAALPPLERDEVVWLARCIFSETNLAHEQRLVAWVVRNRVETAYRGTSYREVILEPLQFSAFNSATPRRTRILKLNAGTRQADWDQALRVALDVYHAQPTQRPFSIYTRHFYSPVSMPGRAIPPWAQNAQPLDSAAFGVDPDRFLFFDAIDETLDPYMAGQPIAAPSTSARIAKRHDAARSRIDEIRRQRRSFSGKVRRPVRPGRSTPRGQQ